MHHASPNTVKSAIFKLSPVVSDSHVNPNMTVLSFDEETARDILAWEAPRSLYTLTKRLHALNQWKKFIPNLSDLTFPLNHIPNTGIFSWDCHSEEAWKKIKSVVMLDITLTVPQKHEQLVLTCQSSNVALSAMLWVERNNTFSIVECYSELFSNKYSSKNIHFKEIFAIKEAFKHYGFLPISTKIPPFPETRQCGPICDQSLCSI